MGLRREVAERKNALRQDLIEAGRSGLLGSGSTAWTQRELSQRYNLSQATVSRELRSLMIEGVLAAGMNASFGGRRNKAGNGDNGLFLLLTQNNSADLHTSLIQNGFEERMAQLGANTLVLDRAAAQFYGEGLPPLSGIFEFDERGSDFEPGPPFQPTPVSGAEMAYLRYGRVVEGLSGDFIYFDNEDGGRQATTHLLRQGHSQIAFLALHARYDVPQSCLWSKERENGWEQAMRVAGAPLKTLAFHPTKIRHGMGDEQARSAQETAKSLVLRREISAVVAVNEYAAQGLFAALREANILPEQWPAVVCFDDFLQHDFQASAHIVTTMRQSWERLGREAAESLWQRWQGQLEPEPQQSLVPMRLVPRLTCQLAWSHTEQMAQLASANTQ